MAANDPYSEQSFAEYLEILRHSAPFRSEFLERLNGPEFLNAYITYLATDDEQCRQMLGNFCTQSRQPGNEHGLRALLDLGLLNVRGVDFMRLYSSYCRQHYDRTLTTIMALQFGNLTLSQIAEHTDAMLGPNQPVAVDFVALSNKNYQTLFGIVVADGPPSPSSNKRPLSRKDFN